MILQWPALVWCHYSYGERRSVRDLLNECAPTNHTSYIPLSLLIGIQNIPFRVVMTYYQYLGVELIDTQTVSYLLEVKLLTLVKLNIIMYVIITITILITDCNSYLNPFNLVNRCNSVPDC